MLPFNAFTIHELLGFVITAPVCVIFYLMFWKLGRQILDLTFATMAACCAAACLAVFLADNVIQAGTDANAVGGAAVHSLRLIRLMYVMALISMPCQLHFVLRYCRRRNVLSRNIAWVYAAFAAAIPATWSRLFLAARSEPLAATSSWTHACPWQPQAGPLVGAFFALWLAVQAYSMVLLWGPVGRSVRVAGGPSSRVGLLRWAILIQAAGGMVATIGASLGYAGASVFAVSSVAAAGIVAAALVQERIGVEREKHRMQRELELASRIQRGLLPKESPALAGFEMAGWSRSAEEAGGDTYDFFPLPDGRWMVTLADASGHGIGPALIISETRAMLRAFGTRCPDALEVLREVRALLETDLPEGQFVTCFLGLLDPAAGVLCYASAGQGPVIFYERATGRFEREIATHLPLPLAHPGGPDPAAVLRERRFAPGDLLVLASDGFWETTGPDGRPFGIPRLVDVLDRGRDLSAAEIIALARREVDRFVHPNKHADDLTMVVLRKS